MRLKGLETLRKKRDFQYNAQYGKASFSKSIILKISQPNMCGTMIKIGFVVSKKIGKAHTRNLIKRRLRVIAEYYLSNLNEVMDCVIIAKKHSSYIPFSELKRDFLYCFKKHQ